jgi:hypothetical protein
MIECYFKAGLFTSEDKRDDDARGVMRAPVPLARLNDAVRPEEGGQIIEVVSVVRCTCQAADDPAQLGLPDRFGCFFSREPPDLAFTVLGPPLALSRYLERVHLDFTDDDAAVLEALSIGK